MNDTMSIARIREIQIGLCGVKPCDTCMRVRPVAAFYDYGVSTCLDCTRAASERAAQARRAAEEAERAERERLIDEMNGSDLCGCGMTKPRGQPRCRWCHAKMRIGVGQNARPAVGV